MEPLSVRARIDRLRSAHAPIHGRSRCPAANGTRSCRTTWEIPATLNALPWSLDTSPNRIGVRNRPARLDPAAEQTAAATLPPAIEVNAIEDCTVEGSTQTNSTPNQSDRGSAGQVRWLLDKCGWGAVVAGALRAAKSSSMSSRTALS